MRAPPGARYAGGWYGRTHLLVLATRAANKSAILVITQHSKIRLILLN
jgi:hypothetical protein